MITYTLFNILCNQLVNNMGIKKVAMLLTSFLMVNTTFAESYSKEEKSTNFIVTPSIAYRYDVFKWSKEIHGSTVSPQVKRSTAAYWYSGQVCMARWLS